MNGIVAIDAEPLLIGSFALSALGIGLVLLLLRKVSALRRDEAALDLDRLRRPAAEEARPAVAASGGPAVEGDASGPLPADGEGGAGSEERLRLLATVTHEFRTPLNGILGMTSLLLQTGLDGEQTTYVKAVRSSAEAFLSLVEEILDLSKIEAGRIEIAREPFDLRALVEGVVELLAPRAQGKGTPIASYVAADVPRRVRGDADRLRQVLLNLAGNAVKFTAAGGAGVSVETGPGGEIRMVVEDTGPGIPRERAAAVFDEFEQGPGEEQTAGTGLGLAITRRLVDRMGGRIELRSVVGVGSRFVVSLPLPAEEEDAPPRAAAPDDLSVLVLSGSPFEGRYIARMLADAGVAAETVSGLEETLGRMRDGRFDVLIADHAVPDGDVRVVAREARRFGIGRSIVLLSPFERRDFGSPHAAGFDAFLVKPVRARSLFERLTAQDRPALAAGRPAARRPSAAAGGRPVRVLLAEDDEVNALIGLRSVEKLGGLVEWARNGEEAWARAEACVRGETLPFDLVLMDLRMPGLDGREVTGRIRDLERVLGPEAPLRILALSADAGAKDGERLRAAGFDGVLQKPLRLDALAAEFDGRERDRASAA